VLIAFYAVSSIIDRIAAIKGPAADLLEPGDSDRKRIE
jgi:hypothetical protein